MVTLLDAVKMAYRKHHLDDPSIGWDELSDVLMMALCNEMGDQGFQNWLHQVSAQQSVQRTAIAVSQQSSFIADGELPSKVSGAKRRR